MAPTRIENRITVLTTISQLLFLLERFVEIADMSWRILRALKVIQPLQCKWHVAARAGGLFGVWDVVHSGIED